MELEESLLPDSCKIDPNLLDFKYSEKLGEGAQCTVIRALYVNTQVACKYFAKTREKNSAILMAAGGCPKC